MLILRFVNLEQRTGGKFLLKNINLDINRGEFFVIIGPTGAGKTTLIRLLDVLDRPSGGDIYLGGMRVTAPGVNLVEVRRRMAAVFQKPTVFNSSVFENVAYGLNIRRVRKELIQVRVAELLALVGLQGYGKRKARTLSGGEAQRVALARAMAGHPEVLLLDEPTANLDPQSAQMIEDLVTRFNRTEGVTVVMTTHDMQQAQRLADRVGVLMAGEFVQVGNAEAVFQSPANMKVAGFVGIKNILRGNVEALEYGLAVINVNGHHINAVCDHTAGTEVNLYIKPEDIIISPQSISSSARNSLKCVVRAVRGSGPVSYVDMDCGFPLEALVTSRSADQMQLQPGQEVFASFKATSVRIPGD